MAGNRALLLLETILLTLGPPWSMMLPGESMTLRCWGSHSLRQRPMAWCTGRHWAPTDTDTCGTSGTRQQQTSRMSPRALAPHRATTSPWLSPVGLTWWELQDREGLCDV